MDVNDVETALLMVIWNRHLHESITCGITKVGPHTCLKLK